MLPPKSTAQPRTYTHILHIYRNVYICVYMGHISWVFSYANCYYTQFFLFFLRVFFSKTHTGRLNFHTDLILIVFLYTNAASWVQR